MNKENTTSSILIAVLALIIIFLFAIILHKNSQLKDSEARSEEELSLYPPIIHDYFGSTYTKEHSYIPYSITVPIDTTYDNKNHLMSISFIGERNKIITKYTYIYTYIKGRQGNLIIHNTTTYNEDLSQNILNDLEEEYTHLDILRPSGRTTLKAIEAPKVYFSSSLGNDPKQIVNNFRKQQKQIP